MDELPHIDTLEPRYALPQIRQFVQQEYRRRHCALIAVVGL